MRFLALLSRKLSPSWHQSACVTTAFLVDFINFIYFSYSFLNSSKVVSRLKRVVRIFVIKGVPSVDALFFSTHSNVFAVV